ncbi:hypothetical protein E2562_004968 [Oryza meyeriana var. granulata]|uniref:Uncharacterized protein n=1 Tax=Oryza meyeriana var. granulata TaxID=110450 RepID=A0A6G1C415_9ORYZ|nr:hypothetical protein E2562_004968 [Oryza meyeriana var. granulata]
MAPSCTITDASALRSRITTLLRRRQSSTIRGRLMLQALTIIDTNGHQARLPKAVDTTSG